VIGETEIGGIRVGELRLTFDHTAVTGGVARGSGRLYVPLPAQADELLPSGRALIYHAGYEASPEAVIAYLTAGASVVTPVAPNGNDAPNPLVRGLNLDVALLHIARALPFIDLGRVFIVGTSAGGYMGLMLAAETFPLAGVLVACPVVNLAFSMRYREANINLVATDRPAVPSSGGRSGLAAAVCHTYGSLDDQSLLRHSPVTHLHEITARVQLVHSTADLWVPIDHIGPDLAVDRDRTLFPEGFAIRPSEMGLGEAVPCLLDHVDATSIQRFQVGDDNPRNPIPGSPEDVPVPTTKVELPWPEHGWAIALLDEGAPEPRMGHFKYALAMEQPWPAIMASHAATDPGQLTPAKLSMMMRRLAGVAWTDLAFSTLDFPDAERRDVLTALRWWAQDRGREDRLESLYGRLPDDLKVLGPGLKLD
jgi:hypothetical protein